jgi:hypothetical protein
MNVFTEIQLDLNICSGDVASFVEPKIPIPYSQSPRSRPCLCTTYIQSTGCSRKNSAIWEANKNQIKRTMFFLILNSIHNAVLKVKNYTTQVAAFIACIALTSHLRLGLRRYLPFRFPMPVYVNPQCLRPVGDMDHDIFPSFLLLITIS